MLESVGNSVDLGSVFTKKVERRKVLCMQLTESVELTILYCVQKFVFIILHFSSL